MSGQPSLFAEAIKRYIAPLISLPINPNDIKKCFDSDITPQNSVIKRDDKLVFYPQLNYRANECWEYSITDNRNISSSLKKVNAIYPMIIEAFKLYCSNKKTFSEAHFFRLCDIFYEKGICENLFGHKSAAIEPLLNSINKWSKKQNEGENIFLAFIVNKNNINETVIRQYSDFLDKHQASVVLTEPNVALQFNKIGFVLQNLKEDNTKKKKNIVHFVPRSLLAFSQQCIGGNVGIVLNNERDILFIEGGHIKYARRAGEWTTFNWESFFSYINLKFPYMETTLIKQIYVSAVDVAFSHCGGSIVIVNDNLKERISEYVSESDLLQGKLPKEVNLEKKQRNEVFRYLVSNKKFEKMDVRERTELIGIDGAMVVDCGGNIISVGSILRNCDESGSGARTAAMKGLSKKEKDNCVAIKISEDGYIDVYLEGENKIHIK